MGIEEWIAAKKQSGEIKQIGFSFHGSYAEFEKLVDAYDWDFTQIQYNYVNVNYQAGQKGLLYAAGKGVPVFIMEPLLGGKLASKGVPLALGWIWDQPSVTLLLSGMNAPEQVAENLSICETALPGSFTEREKQAVSDIVAAFNKSYKIPCTGCGYCMPCPRMINIPACFEAYNNSYAISRIEGIKQYIVSVGAMSEKPRFANDCIKCGACEKRCPQSIEIRKKLKG